MKYDPIKAMKEAVRPVGRRAFLAIIKTITDGLPPGTGISGAAWRESDELSREPTEDEAEKAAFLALWIEKEAYQSIVRLFLNGEFRNNLTKDLQTGNGRKMAKEKSKRRSDPFAQALKSNPNKSSKKIIQHMESEGKIKTDGDYYVLVDENGSQDKGSRILIKSIDSKFSRLRKKLRKSELSESESEILRKSKSLGLR